MSTSLAKPSVAELLDALQEARERTLALVADLSDEQLIGPRLAIVNPLRWEIGHVAWFQEYWVLRHFLGQRPILSNGDDLYNSAEVAHDTRWDLRLPSRADTLAYMRRILDTVGEMQDQLERRTPESGYDGAYFLKLALLHECMHAEAITYTHQTLGYPQPPVVILSAAKDPPPRGTDSLAWGLRMTVSGRTSNPQPLTSDTYIPGGVLYLGSTPDLPFVFDNEQWAHPVEVPPFAIARTAVTQAEFAAFVEGGGYPRRELWSDEGWTWRTAAGAEHPVYWRPIRGGEWQRRNFDQWTPLEGDLPVLHVSWHEAEAYCRWAGRRLPTEAEWELAATAEPTPGGGAITERKRIYPWGDDPPTPERANLDWRAMGRVPVQALPAGDSAFGVRQLIGNVWEWTASPFEPFPGFSPGPYKEYSQPWFGNHRVLRGGCWATRSRLIHSAYRNFYKPDRRDVWAGFRTCAL